MAPAAQRVLPVQDHMLDGVINVHSIYFWTDPAAVLAEIRRGLRPGGRIVLAFRAGEHPLPARFDPTVYRVPTTRAATGWLQAAGFTAIEAHERPRPTAIVWVTATVE